MAERKVLHQNTYYSRDYKEIFCSQPKCWDSIPQIGAGWKAREANWFVQRTGEHWCHRHHPEWVAKWRKKRKKK